MGEKLILETKARSSSPLDSPSLPCTSGSKMTGLSVRRGVLRLIVDGGPSGPLKKSLKRLPFLGFMGRLIVSLLLLMKFANFGRAEEKIQLQVEEIECYAVPSMR
jgi:hypothetical protein